MRHLCSSLATHLHFVIAHLGNDTPIFKELVFSTGKLKCLAQWSGMQATSGTLQGEPVYTMKLLLQR